jgi:hypothetical protein
MGDVSGVRIDPASRSVAPGTRRAARVAACSGFGVSGPNHLGFQDVYGLGLKCETRNSEPEQRTSRSTAMVASSMKERFAPVHLV